MLLMDLQSYHRARAWHVVTVRCPNRFHTACAARKSKKRTLSPGSLKAHAEPKRLRSREQGPACGQAPITSKARKPEM
ncbi:hypothetical protein FVEN_g1444 [Fusarium venenatum]|nr:hypothetical protein FVEN_g1444 [Fusarium venenatum]